MERANRSRWKTSPMPPRQETFPWNKQLTAGDWALLKQGLIPKVMEDRWFIFVEENTVYFHRSWTGFLIFAVSVQPNVTGCLLYEITANRDPDQYKGSNPEADKTTVDNLIQMTLALVKKSI